MNTPSSRTAQAPATSRTPDSGFSYSRPFFEELVDRALAHAKKLGATDAGAEASEGCGLSVSVRKGELVGRVTDIFGELIEEYRAPEDGIVIGRSTHPVNQTGSRIIHLGIEGEIDTDTADETAPDE